MTKQQKAALKDIALAKKEKHTSVSISVADFTEIPVELLELTWIEELSIGYNLISDLSPLAVFKNLRKLDFQIGRAHV